MKYVYRSYSRPISVEAKSRTAREKTLRGVKGVSMETQMQGLKAFEGIRRNIFFRYYN